MVLFSQNFLRHMYLWFTYLNFLTIGFILELLTYFEKRFSFKKEKSQVIGWIMNLSNGELKGVAI